MTGENSGVGAQIVRSTPAPHPAPNADDARSVLDAYCAARAEHGTPVVKPGLLFAPIREALSAGYSASAVLVGLGMWDAEGFRSPKQVGEWVEKAARQEGLALGLRSASGLLEEGRQRYERYVDRKTGNRPTKADQRRLRSMAAIREFNQGAS